MSEKTFTYDPSQIKANGKDRMRFELGDTMVEGAADTCALTDEEINAVLELYSNRWKKAKVSLVESVCRRFSYEVDTKVGPLSLGLQSRAEAWKELYRELKAEFGDYSVPCLNSAITNGSPYFYSGMMDNPSSVHKEGGK